MISKINRFIEILNQNGVRSSVSETVSYLRGSLFKLNSALLSQPVIFRDDWDILIILDACRSDTMKQVSADYEWISEVGTRYSVGPDSPTWMDRTFTMTDDSELSETAYVTANPYSDYHAPQDRLARLEEVWKYAWDDKIGTVPPRPVTDAGINIAQQDYSRVIIHYMQPHFPSIPTNLGYKINKSGDGDEWIWNSNIDDNPTKQKIYSAYEDNLRYVLDEVSILINNLSSDRVVITADHANAFGEHGIWGHPKNQPAPIVLRVPWIVTEATDTEEYQPASNIKSESSVSLTDQLEALGYR